MKLGTGIYLDIIKKDPDFYLENYDHIEIQDFIFLSEFNLSHYKIITEYHELLENYQGTLSLHAPFNELFPSSQDQRIKNIASKRLTMALDLALELGCKRMVVHSCFNPLYKYKDYIKNWLDNSYTFWCEFFEKNNKGIELVLENIWDSQPDHMIELINKINSTDFNACLDVGHVNIFSPYSLSEWLDKLGNRLTHVHLHDNDGKKDDHLTIGEGNIDLAKFLNNDLTKVTLLNEAHTDLKGEKKFLQFMSC